MKTYIVTYKKRNCAKILNFDIAFIAVCRNFFV